MNFFFQKILSFTLKYETVKYLLYVFHNQTIRKYFLTFLYYISKYFFIFIYQLGILSLSIYFIVIQFDIDTANFKSNISSGIIFTSKIKKEKIISIFS